MTLDHQTLWNAQAVLSLIIAGIYGIELARAWRYRMERAKHVADHSTIIATGLVIIALGNAVTSYATGIGDDALRDYAGIAIRGSLFVMAVYLAALGPFRTPRRPLDKPE